MKNKTLIIGPQPPAIGGIASIVYLLREGLEGIDFVDSSKPTGRLKAIFHPLWLVIQLFLYCAKNNRCKVLFFSSAYRSFWEKSIWVLIGRLLKADIYIVMVDGNFPEFYGALSAYKRYLARLFMNKVTVVGQSKSWGEFFRGIFPEAKIKLITGGVDTSFYTRDVIPVKKNDGNLHVLYVGWIIKKKGIYDILAASEILIKKHPNFKVDLVGPIYCNKEELLLAIKEYGLENVITVTGPLHTREELKDKYCSADVFLFPSHYEGFPMALLEAISCGLPCIGSDVGGIPDILNGGECGYIVSPHAPEEIANALSCFIEKTEIRFDKADASRKRAINYYTTSISVDSYRQLLKL